MTTIKILATLGNITLILFMIALASDGGFEEGSEVTLSIIGVILLALINIFVAWRGESNGWIELFLKRKALEEKKRIQSLQEDKI